MMAFNGVRSSCDMLARNSDLCRLTVSSSSYSRPQLVVHPIQVHGQSSELVAVRNLDMAREVAGSDLRKPRLGSLDRPDQRPGENGAEQERKQDAGGADADEEVSRRGERVPVLGDQEIRLLAGCRSEPVGEAAEIVVEVDHTGQERLVRLARRSRPVGRGDPSERSAELAMVEPDPAQQRFILARRHEPELRLVRRRPELATTLRRWRCRRASSSVPRRRLARCRRGRCETRALSAANREQLPELLRLGLQALVRRRPQLQSAAETRRERSTGRARAGRAHRRQRAARR